MSTPREELFSTFFVVIISVVAGFILGSLIVKEMITKECERFGATSMNSEIYTCEKRHE